MTTQPEALQLADRLTSKHRWLDLTDAECDAAAAELRRLHDQNAALRAALMKHIRLYRVSDEAYDVAAESGRIFNLETGIDA